MASVVSGQPVAVGIHAGELDFEYYAGGLYSPMDCPFQMGDLDHAMLVVGFDNESEWGPVWIVKNTWGVTWGDNGYLYIRKGENVCGIAADVVYPVV